MPHHVLRERSFFEFSVLARESSERFKPAAKYIVSEAIDPNKKYEELGSFFPKEPAYFCKL